MTPLDWLIAVIGFIGLIGLAAFAIRHAWLRRRSRHDEADRIARAAADSQGRLTPDMVDVALGNAAARRHHVLHIRERRADEAAGPNLKPKG